MQLLRAQRPALAAGGVDRPLVDQHLDQLFHVEGVALGAADDQLAQRGGDRRELLQQFAGECLSDARIERAQVDALVLDAAAPVAAALEQGRPGQAEHEHRHVAIDLGEMDEEVERAVVGPVQVVELEHDRCAGLRRDAAKHLRRGVERAVADLAGVAADAAQVAAVAEVEPDQVAEQVGVRLRHLGAFVGFEQRRDAGFDLAFRDGDAVAVADLQAPREDVAQQPIGLVARQRIGAALEDAERLGPGVAPGVELAEQPALAQAGVADDGDHRQPALAEQALERTLQHAELGVAADHPRLDTLDAAAGDAKGARPGAQYEVGGDGLVDALQVDRVLCLHVEHAAHVAVRVVADAQRAGRRGLFHARGDVDGDAADAAFGIDAAAEQHVAGVQADANVEAAVAVGALDLGAKGAALGEQRQAAAHGALGVVFARQIGAEHREQVVAGVLQDLAVVCLDDCRAARERAVHHGVDFLGVEALAQLRRADDVEKEDRDLLERLAGASVRGQFGEPGAQRGQAGVDEGVAEQAALSFQPFDDGLELFTFRWHCGTRIAADAREFQRRFEGRRGQEFAGESASRARKGVGEVRMGVRGGSGPRRQAVRDRCRDSTIAREAGGGDGAVRVPGRGRKVAAASRRRAGLRGVVRVELLACSGRSLIVVPASSFASSSPTHVMKH